MRWLGLTITILLWGATWPQILPNDADLPPCHMIVLIALAGAWTVYEFVKVRRTTARAARLGKCTQCGYDLTGNLSGLCPECGTEIVNPPDGR